MYKYCSLATLLRGRGSEEGREGEGVRKGGREREGGMERGREGEREYTCTMVDSSCSPDTCMSY